MAAPAGNQNAKKGRMWAKAIEREIARLESGDLEAGLARIARKLVRIADTGDDDKSQWALREIGDRMDGKPAQALIGGDEDDPAIKTVSEIRIRAVDGNRPTSQSG